MAMIRTGSLLAGQADAGGRDLALGRALPLYAFYSIARMAIAYLLSLVFAVCYGYIAAYNQTR